MRGWARDWARHWLVPLALGGLCAGVYVAPAFEMPFYTKGEAREAVLVQAMYEGRDFVLPMRNGTEIPSKPPLFHWFASLVSAMFGEVTEFAVRVPSIVAAATTVIAAAVVAQSLFSRAAAVVVAVVLASSVTFVVSATAARVDMVLAASVTAGLSVFAIDYFGVRRGLGTCFHVAVAAAVLAKGPVGLVLPWAIVLGTLLACRDREYVGRLRPWRAFAWLTVPAGWYVAAYLQAGDAFLAKQLLQENFQRLLDAEGGGTGHVKPFYAHAPLLLGGFAPWSLMLAVALVHATAESLTTRGKGLRFLLLWLFVPLVLLSCAGSKRAVYMLPAYPAAALLVAWWWTTEQGWTERALSRARAWWRGAGLATACSMSLLFALLLAQVAGAPIASAVSAFMSEGDRANMTAIVRDMDAVRRPAVAVAASCLAVAIAFGAAVVRGRRGQAAVAAGLVAVIAIVGGSMTFQKRIAETQSVAPFVTSLRESVGDVEDWQFFRGVSYPVAFYARRPVPPVERVSDLATKLDVIVFVDADDEAILLAEIAGASRTVVELGRFTYDENPRREALVAVRIGAAAP